jgi:hypothetical protein
VTERTGSPKTTAERLEPGRLLFNEGRYFEAHEAWEEVWLVEGGAMKVLLQGLIQIAAGCHKAGERQAPGCARLIGAGLEKLGDVETLAPEVAGFVRAMAAVHERAMRWQRGESDGIGPIPELPSAAPGAGRRAPAR